MYSLSLYAWPIVLPLLKKTERNISVRCTTLLISFKVKTKYLHLYTVFLSIFVILHDAYMSIMSRILFLRCKCN